MRSVLANVFNETLDAGTGITGSRFTDCVTYFAAATGIALKYEIGCETEYCA